MYDVIVIGAGWAGINAAITASKFGLKTAIIEKDKIGGLCLNYGCIPTKAYFQSAKIRFLLNKASDFGIGIKEPSINFSDIFNRKEKIIKNITSGLEFQLKANKIDLYSANAEIKSEQEVLVEGKTIRTKYLILATGSIAVELADLKFDGKKILSSTDILNLKVLPKNLLIIGAGSIGCEFAWIFANFGLDVTLIEKELNILPGIDVEISKKLEADFNKLGIKTITSCNLNKIELSKFDKVLVCVGRQPNLSKNMVGLVNKPNVYVVGDASGKTLLANAAALEGKTAAVNIYNSLNNIKKESIDYNLIPNSIFVYPEVANVGVISGKPKNLSLKANGFCNILGETGGIIKLFIEDKTGKILGGVLYCPNAAEIISVLVIAIRSGYKLEEFKKLAFTHPSISEAIVDIAQLIL